MNVSGNWLNAAGTQALFDAYEQAGWRLYVVGGAVRNALLRRKVTDIDMSSDAPPEIARDFLENAGFRVIPTGIDHGTLTVVSGGIAHEVTTFRKDVETDGRHATVAFSDDMLEDACRRDFTINALYADRAGMIIDPLDGLADIKGPEIRFIGTAGDRIREDYLRSLRFFRFHAQYAPPGSGFDTDALDAMARNLDGLENLSRERVGSEIMKLLSAPDPGAALGTMAKTGVLGTVLPGADPRFLFLFADFEHQLGRAPDPIARLAALAAPETAATLRLRKADLKRFNRLKEGAVQSRAANALGYLWKEDAPAVLMLHHALLESPLPAQDVLDDLGRGQRAIFPVKPADLADRFSGASLGKHLRKLEAEWVASNFVLTRDQLLG